MHVAAVLEENFAIDMITGCGYVRSHHLIELFKGMLSYPHSGSPNKKAMDYFKGQRYLSVVSASAAVLEEHFAIELITGCGYYRSHQKIYEHLRKFVSIKKGHTPGSTRQGSIIYCSLFCTPLANTLDHKFVIWGG